MAVAYNYNRVDKKVESKTLTKNQEEVLYLLLDERLTPKQIAKNKGVSRQAVYKTISKLKENGYIKEVELNTYFSGGSQRLYSTSSNKLNEYRLHGERLTIKILRVSEKYINMLEKKNHDIFDRNNIRLYKDSIVIYSNRDFWGDSVNKCVKLSLDYWNRFITRLENRYGVHLLTYNTSNIKEFGGEIAKVNDYTARKLNLMGEKLKVFDDKGRLRLIVDKSFNFNELEAVHKDLYVEDMSHIEKYYNSILESKELMTPSEMHKSIQNILLMQETMQAQLLKLMEEINNSNGFNKR